MYILICHGKKRDIEKYLFFYENMEIFIQFFNDHELKFEILKCSYMPKKVYNILL